MRLDKYLKVSRLIKRRTVANDACDNARVSVNGREAKASYQVKVGDVIEIAFGNRALKVEVTDLSENPKKSEFCAIPSSLGDGKVSSFRLPSVLYSDEQKSISLSITIP